MKAWFYILFLFPFLSLSQSIIKGKVTNEIDHDGIHVFNKTQSRYTITNEAGRFEILASVNDTLVFSAVQYKLEEFVVSEKSISQQPIHVFLTVKLNDLGVVYIRPKLSGNLLTDIKSIPTKDLVTAKTLGLPNSDVIAPTQAERKLYTATHGGGILSVDAILNAISGRTKKLKKMVKLERKSLVEDRVHQEFEQMIIADFGILKDEVYRFIFYASEDKLFSHIIKTKNGIVIYQFLQNKAKGYLKQKG